MNDLIKLIPTGRENAILLQELARQTGISDRHIKAQIQRLRDQGNVILSSSAGGYFMPSKDAQGLKEVNHFIAMMEQQAKSRFARIWSAKRWRERYGQTEITESGVN